MPKSSLLELVENDSRARHIEGSPDVFIYMDQGVKKIVDLEELDYVLCDKSKPFIECGKRATLLDRAKREIRENFELGKESYARGLFLDLKSYIRHADASHIPPLSKKAWISYFGANGYLWGLVEAGSRMHAHLYMYDDGDLVGISEKTAAHKKRTLRAFLSTLGLDTFNWDKGLKDFKVTGKPKTIQESYSTGEHERILSRLNAKFSLLAPILIAQYDLLGVDTCTKGHLHKLAESSSSQSNDPLDLELLMLEKMTISQVFNFTMKVAYYLFCHYSAFNDSVITSLRKPISFITEKVEGKVSQYSLVKGYKGRGGKEVKSVFIDDELDESLEEVSARIDKRSGVTFLKLLIKLSNKFGSDRSLLLFEINDSGDIKPFKSGSDSDEIPRKLELFSDSRVGVAERLAESINTLCDHGYIEEVRVKSNEVGTRSVEKIKTYFQPRSNQRTLAMHKLSLAFMQCFTSQSLRHAQMPLFFSEPDEKGKVIITCTSNMSASMAAGDSVIQMYADESYVPVFKKIEHWANKRFPPMRRRKRGNQYTARQDTDDLGFNIEPTKGKSYLLPIGNRDTRRPYGVYPITSNFLSRLGLTATKFYCSLNSSRFRKTVADNEYRYASEASAMAVLQNTRKVFEEHYANGHSGENNEIIAQALDVILEMIRGLELEEAKQKVREDWKVEVLTFDQYKEKKKPTNPNGIFCNGKADFEGKQDTLAQKAANDLGVTEGGTKTNCYQYDRCDDCLSAKLVDDPEQVYKLLSFIESLIDAAELHPQNEALDDRILSFESLISANISEDVLEQAEAILEAKGRYFMYQ